MKLPGWRWEEERDRERITWAEGREKKREKRDIKEKLSITMCVHTLASGYAVASPLYSPILFSQVRFHFIEVVHLYK